MRPYLTRAAKAAAVAVVATVAGWKVFDGLYVWADRAAGAKGASGESEWFAGFTEYLIADAAGILFLPFAVWAGLRLARVKGNHLAVIVSGLTWFTLTAPHLVDTRLGLGTVIWWVTVETSVTAAAAALQTAPASAARR